MSPTELADLVKAEGAAIAKDYLDNGKLHLAGNIIHHVDRLAYFLRYPDPSLFLSRQALDRCQQANHTDIQL